jgi:hypothetical protein
MRIFDLRSIRCHATFLAVGMVVLTLPARAQDAAISGAVQDTSGAAVPKASVKLISPQRGTTLTAETNDAGIYQFSFLQGGGFNLEVSARGFKTQTRTNIVLATAQNMRVDFKMEIGNVTETVTVQANTGAVDTESSETGAVVDNTKVVEMPLNGRLWWSLAELAPGVIPPAQGSANGFRGGFNVSGMTEQSNNFTLNGMFNNDATTSSPAFRPSIDAIQEFNILTGIYPAQYGYGAGGQVMVTTKSGTNQFHGSLFEFIRNQAVLTARNFFQPAGSIPSFKRNQFGGTAGGPIRKDKTFFFFSYEGLRLSQDITQLDTVPTAAMHSGNFSSLLPGKVIKDPTTGAPFAGNVIPPTRLSAVGMALINLYPTPTYTTAAGAQPVNNYAFSEARPENSNAFTLKLDHSFSARDSGYATANYFNDTATERISTPACGANPLPGFSCYTFVKHELYGLAETHIFSPTMVNEARVGANYEFNPSVDLDAAIPFWSQFGITPLTTAIDPGLPHLGPPTTAITGFTGWSTSVFRRNDPRYQFADTFSWTRGKHTIKMGASIYHIGLDCTVPTSVAGSVSFTNTSAGPTTGYGAADVVLGFPASTTLKPDPVKIYPREMNFAAYIQDDYKVSQRLTLNFGLRWEMNTPPIDLRDLQTSFDPVKGIPVTENSDGYGTHMFSFDWHDYAPRLGFAWQPFGDGKTVIRGGAGTFYDAFPLYNAGTADIYAGYPITVTNAFTSSVAQPVLLSNPFPTSNAVISNTLSGAVYKFLNARIYEWSLGIQRQLTRDTVFEATYFGSAGNHLRVTENINQPAPGAGTPVQVNARRPYPLYGTISMINDVGNSTYESLRLRFQKNYGYGLSFLGSYTYSHSIDDVNTATNAYNLLTARGSSSYDVRSRLVISSVWELPFGKGRRFVNQGVMAEIVGGWQLSPLFQWQTGNPLTPTLSGNYSNSGGTTDRPFAICDPNSNAPHTPQKWFNTSCFQVPIANGQPGAQYSFGNAGVGTIISPGLVNLDFSLVRNFAPKEWLRIQFRAEIFDALNHPNFGYPAVAADTATFGTISSALDPRESQFAIKLTF